MLAEWFWIERWEGSSAAMLPMEAQGIYRAMLSHAWRRGASLPVDLEEIQLLIRCRAKEWERSWPLVKPYWMEEGGVLVNETQQEVYREALGRKERAQARAQAGAQASAQARAQAKRKVEHKQSPPITNHQSNELPIPPARDPDPEVIDGQNRLHAEAIEAVNTALSEATAATGLSGLELLSLPEIRPPKGTPITNPAGVRPTEKGIELLLITADKLRGMVASRRGDALALAQRRKGRAVKSALGVRDGDAEASAELALVETEIQRLGGLDAIARGWAEFPTRPQFCEWLHGQRVRSDLWDLIRYKVDVPAPKSPEPEPPKPELTLTVAPGSCPICQSPLRHSTEGGDEVIRCSQEIGACDWSAVWKSVAA